MDDPLDFSELGSAPSDWAIDHTPPTNWEERIPDRNDFQVFTSTPIKNSVPPKSKQRRGKYHGKVTSKHDYAEARDFSTGIFGNPSDPLRVKYNDFAKLLAGINVEKMDRHTQALLSIHQPFLRRVFANTINKPPTPPPTNGRAVTQKQAEAYLKESRHYRAMFPTLDKATKVQMYPLGRDSTYAKFELGVVTEGAYHIGAGRIYAPSVPRAAAFIDWMLNTDFLTTPDKPQPGQLIVSDAAVPSEDGLGVGAYPEHISYLHRRLNEGHPIIAKISFWEYKKLPFPAHILYKPRAHNAEIIISAGIPGVSLNPDRLLQSLVEENHRRNQQCYTGVVPEIPWGELEFDETLLGVTKNFDALFEGISACPAGHYGYDKTVNEAVDPHKLENILDKGVPRFTEHVNQVNIQKLNERIHDYDDLRRRGKAPTSDVYGDEPRESPQNTGNRFVDRWWEAYPTNLFIKTFPSYSAETIADIIFYATWAADDSITLSKDGKTVDFSKLLRAAKKAKKRKEA